MQMHVLVCRASVRYVDSKERHVEVCMLRHAVRPWQSLSHAACCPAGRTAAVGLNTASTGCCDQSFRNDVDDKPDRMAQTTGKPRKELGWCQEPDTGGKTRVRFLAEQATFVIVIALRPQWVMGGLFVGGGAELTAEQSAPEGPSPCSEDHATCPPQPD